MKMQTSKFFINISQLAYSALNALKYKINTGSCIILIPQMGNQAISEERLKKPDVSHKTESNLPPPSLPCASEQTELGD